MGTEGIQDKYINPYADFGFKLLFGTAMNKELFEAAEIAKFNPKELGEYWESLKNFRDWYSVMSTQLKKGREEGLKEGLEQGHAFQGGRSPLFSAGRAGVDSTVPESNRTIWIYLGLFCISQSAFSSLPYTSRAIRSQVSPDFVV